MYEIASTLADKLAMPSLEFILHPFIALIEILSRFKIDLGSIDVTCEGSQAPIELFVNCFVLGAIIIIIKSDFHIYQNIVFASVNLKVAKAAMTFPLGLKGSKFLILKCGIAYTLSTMNPLIKGLQFAMSSLSFSVFFRESYIMHRWTQPCNEVAGFEGIELFFAVFTSLIAWYLMMPAAYMLATVCVPYNDNVPSHIKQRELKYLEERGEKETSERNMYFTVLKYFSIFAPDLLIASLDAWSLNSLLSTLGGTPKFSDKSIIWSAFRRGTSQENEDWRILNEKSLPNYFMLCHLVQSDFCEMVLTDDFDVHSAGIFSLKSAFWCVAYLVPFSHLLTKTGQIIWKMVFRKFCLFFLAMIGYWTDACVDVFDLENKAKIMIDDEVGATDDGSKKDSCDYNGEMGEAIRMIVVRDVKE